MRQDLILAIDFATEAEVLSFFAQFDEPLLVKIGMELFYQTGPALMDQINALCHDIFSDLTLHDIPNTVGKARARRANLTV
ncbi:orotidine-5'-phosphate decarboxylase, partial [Staphylococcus pseudintermedius]|uniref:orotidine 5'-phosphate decarboxylase / HUMPS family protein n=1 Tax=Staphylococcus pseudintermedius TaxID=283734 RepID=UPI000E36E856